MLRMPSSTTKYFTDFHIFCGSGGGALGFQQAEHEYKGVVGKFKTLGGIDCDPDCISDFKKLTGVDATLMDLFDRQQYIDFWGHEPPKEWKEVVPADILKASQGQHPDVIFLSPPCKGFSGLLPAKSASTPKYQALNRLVFRSMQLVMEAYKDNLPAAILIENVPRIRTRGAILIQDVKELLGMYGYVFHDGIHDCGEIGGLGQTRTRFLLIARNPRKLMSFVYQPQRYALKSIGEVLNSVPLPGDIKNAGTMHRIPKLQWKTWVRLALIPAGKDWRALNEKNTYANLFQIVPWEKNSSAITGALLPSNGAVSVADPRLENVSGYGNKYRITEQEAPAPTITGSRIGSGAILFADSKLDYTPRQGAFRVVKWGEPAPTVTGSTGAGRSNGISAISDPRLDYTAFNRALKVVDWNQPNGAVTSGDGNVADPRLTERAKRYPGTYKVAEWDKPCGTILCQTDIQTGAQSLADPRVSTWRRTQVSKVQDWNQPSGTITGSANISGAGSAIVSDPRLGCTPRSGCMEVQEWDSPSKTIFANMDVHAGSAAVADPRIPPDTESGVWLIIAEDGSWHRPITTYEMAMLQGLPSTFSDGSPLVLSGDSEKKWREHIGNMVPPPAACAIATSMLATMIPNLLFGEWHWDIDGNDIWVRKNINSTFELGKEEKNDSNNQSRPMERTGRPAACTTHRND